MRGSVVILAVIVTLRLAILKWPLVVLKQMISCYE